MGWPWRQGSEGSKKVSVIGVSAAITGLLGIMFHKIASDALKVTGDSEVKEDE